MAVFGAILAVVLLNVRINGEITRESIEQFNIGQLFAFYEAENLCKTPAQFAVAKKIGSNDCQWEIRKNLQPAIITSENLPVRDIYGVCYFSCVFEAKLKECHTEKVINRKLKENKIDRSKFDLYTYLPPCQACIYGTAPGEETAECDAYNEVYYSKKFDTNQKEGSKVGNVALLEKDAQQGLAAIKEITKVSLSNVKNAIKRGNRAGKGYEEIINEMGNLYERNAVKSYFDQHPQKYWDMCCTCK